MDEILKEIEAAFTAFTEDATAQAQKGNKTAGTRARVSSIKIEKLMKEFRKASLEFGK